MKKNFTDREFTQWYLELMIWLMGVIIFAGIAVILGFKPVLLVSIVCAIVLAWRLMKLQQLYNFYKTNLAIMKECFSDVAIFTWVSAFRTVLVSGNSQMLVEDWVPLSDTMTREQLEALLERITEHLEDPKESIYKIKVGNKDKWIQFRCQQERGMQIYIISDVTDSVLNKAELMSFTYYDQITKLLSKDAFEKSVNELMETYEAYGGYVVVEIRGHERTTTQQKVKIDQCLNQIAVIVKQQEQDQSVIAGRISNTQFVLYYYNTNMMDADRDIVMMAESIRSYLQSFNELNNTKLNYVGGVCHFPAQAGNYYDLVSKADFAMFEAGNQRANKILEFSEEIYIQKEVEYSRVQAFNHVLNGNLFDYHFQPIVDAHTGEIFAYEALMRPRSDVLMTPLEIIKIAEEEDRLDEIERLTFINTMRVLSENQDVFTSKKLFINTIPNCYVSQEFFDSLMNDYGALMEKVVVEITEEQDMTDDMDAILQNRYRNNNIKIALDDFGSGYANESNLLRCQPDFVKLDRSLLVGIDKDQKKRHLVSNMMSFAKEHGIKVIAEGIETEEELQEVISLDVDYIQGFCTSKPRSVMLLEISQEISKHIVDMNLGKNIPGGSRVYEASENDKIELVKLALQDYRVIQIHGGNVHITGDTEHKVDMVIQLLSDANVTLENCYINDKEVPIIDIAEEAELCLTLEGDNVLEGQGIRVPGTSKLQVKGSGNLSIKGAREYALGIGGTAEQDWGSIRLEQTGHMQVSVSGDKSIGIGGGIPTALSQVIVQGGIYGITATGEVAIGIGTLQDFNATICPDQMWVRVSGQRSAGIGSLEGVGHIELLGNILVSCNGDECVGIGTHHAGKGGQDEHQQPMQIECSEGEIGIRLNMKRGTGIGCIDGPANVKNTNATIDIHMEGMDLVGIGNLKGEGDIQIHGGIMKLAILSEKRKSIYTNHGKIYVYSGNILTNVPVSGAYNRYEEALTYTAYQCDTDVSVSVTSPDGKESDVYTAKQTSLMAGYIGVLLPEQYALSEYEVTDISFKTE